MALTPEQQSQVDVQVAVENARAANQAAADASRAADLLAADTRRAKLEAVRLAKEVLIENRRNLPVDQREVSAADITAFADSLVAYVNA